MRCWRGKRNWIRARKWFGGGGGKIPSRLHLVEHQSGLDANQKRQRIAQDTGGWIAHPDPEHWVQKSSTGGGWTQPTERTDSQNINISERQPWDNAQSPTPKGEGNSRSNCESQLRSVERAGFSDSSSSDRLTDEQREDLIAENIYDWWISGKSYKKWYADKFLQLKFEFE